MTEDLQYDWSDFEKLRAQRDTHNSVREDYLHLFYTGDNTAPVCKYADEYLISYILKLCRKNHASI